jgi:hypothetical protein
MAQRVRTKTKVFCIVGFLLVAVVALWPTIVTFLVQGALRDARLQGAKIAWQGVSASYFTVNAELLEAWIPGPPIEVSLGAKRISVPGPALKLEFRDSSIAVAPLSLMTLSPRFHVSTRLYGGSVEADISGVRSPLLTVDLLVKDVTIGKHPQLSAMGVEGGVISATGTQLTFSNNDQMLTGGAFSIELARLALPERPELKAFLKLTTLNLEKLAVIGEVKDGNVALNALRLASSLGTAEGDGSFSPPRKGRPLVFQVKSKVSLSPNDGAKVAEWLPIITGGTLTATDLAFLVKGRTVPCSSGGGAVLRYTWGCVTTTFEPSARSLP